MNGADDESRLKVGDHLAIEEKLAQRMGVDPDRIVTAVFERANDNLPPRTDWCDPA